MRISKSAAKIGGICETIEKNKTKKPVLKNASMVYGGCVNGFGVLRQWFFIMLPFDPGKT